MKKQVHCFGLPLIILVSLFFALTLHGCAPTKVQIYPRETRTERAVPPKATSEATAQETASLDRTQTEKIPTAKPAPEKTYDETVTEWKSYQDLMKWMERDFSLDVERFKKFEGTLPIPRTPEETFQLKSGIYIDAAMFCKETLNRINPSYKAQIVILIVRRYGLNHYACSFRKDGNLFIMDYGTPYKEVTGVHGPYRSLEEYKKFYETYCPVKGEIEAITYLP